MYLIPLSEPTKQLQEQELILDISLKKSRINRLRNAFFPDQIEVKNCFNMWTALVFFKVIITLWDTTEYKIYQITYRDFNK